MQDIEILKAGINDIFKLREIGIKTFSETFYEGNTHENLRQYLEEAFAVEKLEAELNDVNTAFYFAKRGDEIIGYLKLNFGESQTEIKDTNALEIERIYVLKIYQGRQLAPLLFNKAIEIARLENINYVWLGVWEENHRAIRFYKKNGFTEFDKHIFKLGNDEQTDIMMRLYLK